MSFLNIKNLKHRYNLYVIYEYLIIYILDTYTPDFNLLLIYLCLLITFTLYDLIFLTLTSIILYYYYFKQNNYQGLDINDYKIALQFLLVINILIF